MNAFKLVPPRFRNPFDGELIKVIGITLEKFFIDKENKKIKLIDEVERHGKEKKNIIIWISLGGGENLWNAISIDFPGENNPDTKQHDKHRQRVKMFRQELLKITNFDNQSNHFILIHNNSKYPPKQLTLYCLPMPDKDGIYSEEGWNFINEEYIWDLSDLPEEMYMELKNIMNYFLEYKHGWD